MNLYVVVYILGNGNATAVHNVLEKCDDTERVIRSREEKPTI